MALVAEFRCTSCGQTVHEVVTCIDVCQACRKKEWKRAKREHLYGLAGLTLEERVRRIEEQLYDLDIDRRFRVIESKNVRY